MIALFLAPSFVPAARVRLEKEVRFGETRNWHVVGRASPTASVTLSIILEPEDILGAQKLESKFWAVSDPDSSEYGLHLSKTEVTDLIHASPAALDSVHKWLDAHGATSHHAGAHRDSIEAVLRVADAERLLDATLYEYEHSRGARLVRVGPGGYSVPASLASSIRLVEGIARLPALDGPRAVADPEEAAAAPAAWPSDCGGGTIILGCSKKVTPAVLSQRYSLPPPPVGAAATNGSTLAVAEFQGQVWDQSDLDHFASECKGSISWNVTVDHEAGKVAPGNICKIPIFGTESCGEALLDIEYAKAIGGDIPLTDVYQGQYNLLKWADGIAALDAPPLVHSVSYGNDEAQQSGVAYMRTANEAFMKLGARGISVLFASGDQGVCGREGCGFSAKNTRYHPDFPASSPYITAVGGTDFLTKTVIGDETAWPDGGGGFSDTFAIPDYQQAAVAAYKSSANATLPPQAYWNATGRGYPDVSALAGEQNPYCIGVGSMMMGIAGTSAATPVVAAIFARLNAARLGAGGKPLGFLNPWIYKNAAAFNDVTHGVNDEGSKTHGGFAASAGWDPATGVGTPNFAAMLKAL